MAIGGDSAGVTPVPGSAADQGTSAVEATNDALLNRQLSDVISALGTSSAAWVTKLTDIATAITNSLIGGVTGASANLILVSKGTSGRALQPTNTTLNPSTGAQTFPGGGAVQTGTVAGNTLLLRAYDVDGAAYTTFGTLTANNIPTFDLAAATTKGGSGIAITTQTEYGVWLIPFLDDGDYRVVINLPFGLTITSTTTRCTAGTATATYKINTTPLGGTANAVSTSEVTESHSSANVMVAGDDVVITVSASSGCQNATLSLVGTRVLS